MLMLSRKTQLSKAKLTWQIFGDVGIKEAAPSIRVIRVLALIQVQDVRLSVMYLSAAIGMDGWLLRHFFRLCLPVCRGGGGGAGWSLAFPRIFHVKLYMSSFPDATGRR